MTFSEVIIKRMNGLIETANKNSAWEMEAAAEMMKAVHLLTLVAVPGVAQGSPSHASWSDADYARARDCMIGLLRGHGWTISEGSKGVGEFDNAFQHAVGILSLSNQGASK